MRFRVFSQARTELTPGGKVRSTVTGKAEQSPPCEVAVFYEDWAAAASAFAIGALRERTERIRLTRCQRIAGQHRPEPSPSVAHCFVTNIDAPLEHEVLDVPQRDWEADIHHHGQADDLRR